MGYPPFYGPSNPQLAPPNPNLPMPYPYDAASKYPQGTVIPSQGASSRPHRRQTLPSQPLGNGGGTLKSAMKRTMNVFTNAETAISRQISNPFNNQQTPPTSATHNNPRPRLYSNPAPPQGLVTKDEVFEPDSPPLHMFVSFVGSNELRIENIMKLALDEVRKLIWPLWPDGIESDTLQGHNCIVKFRNSPWDLVGPNTRNAYKLIVSFFRLFQTRGYSFQTAVNITTPAPRLIFQVTQPDPKAEFFLAYISQEGRRFTVVSPPQQIEISIGVRLRSALHRKVVTENPSEEDDSRIIEIKKKPNSNIPEIDPALFFVEILKVLNSLGFQLDATVPLNRRGNLGRRSVRELFIFKAVMHTT
ncbi:hypothetical protein BJ165DRAFT_1398878 [Panaeolus papilionaceus]|nr:hypothetical protein BJ165DRAFT_1398878 [Panaeolus papilionaceus]